MDNRGQDNSESHNKLPPSSELKKKKGKKRLSSRVSGFIGMVLVLAIAAGGYYASQVIKPAPKPEATAKPSTVVQIIKDTKREDFASVMLTRKGGDTLQVNKLGTDVYALNSRTGYSYTLSKVQDIEYQCVGMYASTTVEENAPDLAKYGLDNPEITADITYTNGAKRTILIGDRAPTGSYYYTAEKGSHTVYAVSTSVYTTLMHNMKSLHTVNFTTLADPATIDSVRIERPNQPAIALGYVEDSENNYSISALKMKEPFYYDAHSERSSALFEGIVGLAVSSFEVEATDLAQYGLDKPTVLSASAKDGSKVRIELGTVKDDEYQYCRIDNTNDVYLAPLTSLAFLKEATVAKLVDQFAGIVNITGVDAIDIDAQGTHYNLKIERKPDLNADGTQKADNAGKPATVDTYYLDGEVKEEDQFKKVYQEIIGTLVDGLTNDYALKDEAIVTVKFTMNKGDKREFVVEYLPYDRDYYAVRQNGNTYFYIRKDKVQQMVTVLEKYKAGTYATK